VERVPTVDFEGRNFSAGVVFGLVMKARIRPLWLCGLLVLPVLLTGCGGLHATGAVSPIDFLLPGAGRLLRVEKKVQPAPVDCATNALVAVYEVPVSIQLSEEPER
jgi:hypothetical protein